MWAALEPVIAAILRAILPFIWEKVNAPSTAEDSGDTGDLRDRLTRRVRNSDCFGAGWRAGPDRGTD